MNKALLEKQAWKIISEPDSMVSTTLLNKYCRKEPFTKVKDRPGSSWIWRSILTGRDVILKSLDVQVWSGQQTATVNGNMTQTNENNSPLLKDLIRPISHTWKTWQAKVILIKKTLDY